MPSWGTAHTKYALGEPAKLGISSEAVDVGAVKTTSVPSFWNLNLMDGLLAVTGDAADHPFESGCASRHYACGSNILRIGMGVGAAKPRVGRIWLSYSYVITCYSCRIMTPSARGIIGSRTTSVQSGPCRRWADEGLVVVA